MFRDNGMNCLAKIVVVESTCRHRVVAATSGREATPLPPLEQQLLTQLGALPSSKEGPGTSLDANEHVKVAL